MSAPSRKVAGADGMAPLIAVVGDSVRPVGALRSQVLEQGLTLFSNDIGTEADGAAAITPNVVLMDVAESATAEQVEGQLRAYHAKWNAPVLCLVEPAGQLTPGAIATLGADDYLLKPLRSDELVTRILVMLQRWTAKQGAPVVERRSRSRRKDDRERIQTESCLVVDEAGKTISIEGRALELSPKEYELLRLLASNPGRTLSPQEIVEKVWLDVARASSADVHQYIHMLRRKIEPDPKQPRWILTVRGFGYKLVFPSEA